MNDLKASVIESREEMQRLSSQWNPLLEASHSKSVFLTWEWVSSWSECYLNEKRKLYIIVIHKKGTLIGIAPFYLEYKKWGPFILREIRFLGTPESGSDYLDVLAQKNRAKEVADAIYDFLVVEGASEWDQLALQDIPADSLFLLHFLNCIQKNGKFAEITTGAYCPVIKFNNNYDEYFAGLSAERRRRFRRDIQLIKIEGNVVNSVIRGKNISCNLSKFFELYNEKTGWARQRLKTMMFKYLEKTSREIPLQLDFIEVNGNLVAGSIHLIYKNVLFGYLMVVDKTFNPKISLGNLLIGMCIKDAIERGYTVYDFLKGDESYKFHWANDGKRTLQLKFWNKHTIGIFSGMKQLLKNSCKLIIR